MLWMKKRGHREVWAPPMLHLLLYPGLEVGLARVSVGTLPAGAPWAQGGHGACGACTTAIGAPRAGVPADTVSRRAAGHHGAAGHRQAARGSWAMVESASLSFPKAAVAGSGECRPYGHARRPQPSAPLAPTAWGSGGGVVCCDVPHTSAERRGEAACCGDRRHGAMSMLHRGSPLPGRWVQEGRVLRELRSWRCFRKVGVPRPAVGGSGEASRQPGACSLAFRVGLRAYNRGRGCPALSPPPGEAGRASAGSSQYPLGHALLLRGGKGAQRLRGQSR